MAQRGKATSGIAAVLLGAGVLAMHEGVSVGRTVVVDCHLWCAEIITNPATREAVTQGRSLFKAMRAGNSDEQVVAKAGCALMNAGLSEDPGQQAVADQIRTAVAYDVGDEVADRSKKYINRAASAVRAAQLNGGVGRWYVQYCVFG